MVGRGSDRRSVVKVVRAGERACTVGRAREVLLPFNNISLARSSTAHEACGRTRELKHCVSLVVHASTAMKEGTE